MSDLNDKEQRAVEAVIVAALRGITPEQLEEEIVKREKRCEWHKGEESIDEEDMPSCPHCQRMLNTRTCDGCHHEFLDWEGEGYDDVMASPRASSDGDLCCTGCIARVEREIERRDDDEDDEDYYGEMDE